jgi:2,3-bisphosphoglycerate-dependent phosphoglycerate mutase
VSAEQQATRIVLVRHGESRCNVEQVVGGRRGCTGLTPHGVEQVQALADRLLATGELAAAALYASSLPRAIETAEILRPALEAGRAGALPVRVDAGLREIDPGEADGLTWREAIDRFGPVDLSRPWTPGSEAWVDFVGRAAAAVERLADEHPGQLVVVACHGGIVEAAMVRFLPLGEGVDWLALRTKYASMTEWERVEGRWTLLRYNDGGEPSARVMP